MNFLSQIDNRMKNELKAPATIVPLCKIIQ